MTALLNLKFKISICSSAGPSVVCLTCVVLNQSSVGELCAVSAHSQGHVWFTEDIIISTITVRKHEISIGEIYHCCCSGSCLDLQQPCPNTDIYHRHSHCSLSSQVMWQYAEYCCIFSVQSQQQQKSKRINSEIRLQMNHF